MWINYHSLNPQLPTELLTRSSRPTIRRPMVSRLKQSANNVEIPKTIVTVYNDRVKRCQSSNNVKRPWYRKIFGNITNRRINIANIRDNIILQWERLIDVIRRDNYLLLLLMFLDVAINTVMIILNYTILVVDFFDDIDQSTTVLSRTETSYQLGNDDHGETEQHYWKYLANRWFITQRLNTVIFIIIYFVQLIGFYGLAREIESLLVIYVTILSIQMTVLSFTVIIRPLWLPVCLHRLMLFILALKQCLRMSDRNVNQVWDFEYLNSNMLPIDNNSSQEITNRRTEMMIVNNNNNNNNILHDDEGNRPIANGHINNQIINGRAIQNKKSDLPNVDDIDQRSVIEMMSSIKHVVNIPVPISSFDADSVESIY